MSAASVAPQSLAGGTCEAITHRGYRCQKPWTGWLTADINGKGREVCLGHFNAFNEGRWHRANFIPIEHRATQ